jgi:hypothetical protein
MSKPLALTAALLLLAGCNASNPTAPSAVAPAPSFDHTTTGCPVAELATGGTDGNAHVYTACGLGH